MKLIALLPMKAHSARVENKNFRDMAGRPLYKWVLQTLIGMDEIDQVIINTDADQILNDPDLVSMKKVLLRERKIELRGDEVSMNRIIADDLAATDAELYLMTHTTNPLLSAATIRDALSRFENQPRNDSLFGVNRFQTRFYRENGSAVNHDPANLIPTQDLEPWYEENSTMYLFTGDSFAATNARIGRLPMMYVTPKAESIDIDEWDDWLVAEALITQKEKNRWPEYY